MFFKRKKVCDHYFELVDKYYIHELTQYKNGSDSIELIAVQKCQNCSYIEHKSIDTRYYPVINKDSRELKRNYLNLLKVNEVKTKEEYLLSVL